MRQQGIGIAFVGFGRAARTWHAPVYRTLGLRVVGGHDVAPGAITALAETHPAATHFATLDELLADPRVDVVDLATRPPGRLELLERILAAGKHVLVQKPISADVPAMRSLADRADALGLRVAVNVNGRWAPAWRRATELVHAGAIGAVQAVTHVYDTRVSFTADVALQGTDQFLLFDYTTHWADITQHWLRDHPIAFVQARADPAPVQPEDGQRLETMWLATGFEGGPTAVIRGVAAATSRTGHPFWVHGTEGTIRGDADCTAGDWVELEDGGGKHRFELTGSWFPDGFGGAMSELLTAVVESREPSNSLRDHLRTAWMVAAACESTRQGGAVVTAPA